MEKIAVLLSLMAALEMLSRVIAKNFFVQKFKIFDVVGNSKSFKKKNDNCDKKIE